MTGTHALAFLVPGDPATVTGGYRYDRCIAAGLPRLGIAVHWHRLADTFPDPDAAALAHADAVLSSLADGQTVVIDGLAFGAMPDVVLRHAQRLHLAALIHHPLAFETGLPPARAQALLADERRALAAARTVIVTSRNTAQVLERWEVPAERIVVVEPGTDPAPPARGSGDAQSPALLCVAALTPRKGHLALIEALAALNRLDWRLRCIGSTQRDPRTAAAVAQRIAALGLADRIRVAGEVSQAELQRSYHEADVFVLASAYEGYGMAFAEALAHGLPVVGIAAGAVADTVPADAGLLVPPGDVQALSAALARLLDDASLRARLAAGARAARERLPRWPDSCERFAQALPSMMHRS